MTIAIHYILIVVTAVVSGGLFAIAVDTNDRRLSLLCLFGSIMGAILLSVLCINFPRSVP